MAEQAFETIKNSYPDIYNQLVTNYNKIQNSTKILLSEEEYDDPIIQAYFDVILRDIPLSNENKNQWESIPVDEQAREDAILIRRELKKSTNFKYLSNFNTDVYKKYIERFNPIVNPSPYVKIGDIDRIYDSLAQYTINLAKNVHQYDKDQVQPLIFNLLDILFYLGLVYKTRSVAIDDAANQSDNVIYKQIDDMVYSNLFMTLTYEPLIELNKALKISVTKITNEVTEPAYIRSLHADTSLNTKKLNDEVINTTMNLNSRLFNYLHDMGLDDINNNMKLWKPTDIDKITGTEAQLQVYIKDVYTLYKLIVRDTVLHRFRSTPIDKLPKKVSDLWTSSLGQVSNFLENLLFIDISTYVEPIFLQDRNELLYLLDTGRFSSNAMKYINQDSSPMRIICGDNKYRDFITHVARDTKPGDAGLFIRIEKLLEMLATLDTLKRNKDIVDSEIHEDERFKSILSVIEYVADHINSQSSTIFSVFNLLRTPELNTQLSNKENIQESDVLTFVKIRNDSKNEKIFNERFKILTDQNRQTMLLEYEDDENKRYVKEEPVNAKKVIKTVLDKKAPKTASKTFVETKKQKTTGRGYRAPISKKYIFGPFTKIYDQYQEADYIAGSITSDTPNNKNAGDATIDATIVKRLNNGKDVCIFGYGQSGSGKTSILIFYKTGNKSGIDGIMSRICEKVYAYDRLEVTIKEIGILDQVDTKNPIIISNDEFYLPHKFVKNSASGSWELVDDDPVEIVDSDGIKITKNWGHKYLPELPIAFPTQEDRENNIKNIDPVLLKRLSGYVYFVTENRRLTKATTNNPVSSRAHIFVFIKFYNQNDKTKTGPTLIIGDFAGVENKFNCNSSEVLKAFADITLPKITPTQFAYEPEINQNYDKYIKSVILPVFGDTDYTKFYAKYSEILAGKNNNMLLESCRNLLSNSFNGPIDSSPIVSEISSMINFKVDYDNTFKSMINDPEFTSGKSYVRRREIVDAIIENSNFHNKYKFLMQINGVPTDLTSNGAAEIKANFNDRIFKQGGKFDYYMFHLIEHAKQLFTGNICRTRVDEGIYINNSLKNFRAFLSQILSSKGAVPKINSYCGALQCNPFYMDCYGSLFNLKGANPEIVERCLAETLCPGTKDAKQVFDCLQNVTYCVFNVINISQERNDPPPIPFIDINDLVFAYNQLESKRIKGDTAPNIPPINIIGILNDVNERLVAHTTIDSVLKGEISNKIKIAIDNKRIEDNTIPENFILDIIEEFDNLNAPTFIGTMNFTDSVAKFGTNRMMCVVQQDQNSTFDKLIMPKLSALQEKTLKPLNVNLRVLEKK